ncbi:acyl-CoA dehydratase activase [Deferrisoma camini]|uniref:acyl-CoA dehydratase activase n=1 Tax=Deferrisoma camini TaxID=1035120 RepID=UPI00046CE1CF|nr:acyl-CoA dehydratase activase [Deferrisoma camini]
MGRKGKGLAVGCDVGSVAVKAVVLVPSVLPEADVRAPGLLDPFGTGPPGYRLYAVAPTRGGGDPVGAAEELLERLRRALGPASEGWTVRLTGAAGRPLAARTGAVWEHDLRALARAVGLLLPGVRTVFEIGGESARYLRIAGAGEGVEVPLLDYDTNSECAAGTGAFLDQQALRLGFGVDEMGPEALRAERAAKIAGRCSVFAKSDMIHAQQKGASPAEVLRGLCEAIARNFRTSVVKARPVEGPAALVGGVALNRAVVEAVRGVFSLDGGLLVPEHPCHWGAVGAALGGLGREPAGGVAVRAAAPPGPGEPWEPLDMAGVVVLRDRVRPKALPAGAEVYVGIDVGSVSTNLVCVDADGDLVHEIYLRTRGRPVQVVREGLRRIEADLGPGLRVAGCATTGSGRELVGELVGADLVVDEITAHKTGAFDIARRHLGSVVDTIFEIGGQDAKFIRLTDGVVVDFAMNEACAAGTGSFLEEQAAILGVRIEGEFARLALSSRRPARLGERCTVFMERDVAGLKAGGAGVADIVAGLAYAVVQNYLNRVVKGRSIGDVIFFQGGTAYNDAVAAAFSKVLGKTVVVPPHNGVLGAYGAALLARERRRTLGSPSRFRGFRLGDEARPVRVFTCQGCSNRCDVQEYRVGNRRSYWGDRCGERYRRPAEGTREPVIPDLFALRESLLAVDPAELVEDPRLRQALREPARGPAVGIPRCLYFVDQLPFWRAYLQALGLEVRLSGPTTPALADRGAEAAVAEPCFPVQVAHGHVLDLLDRGVDAVLLPNVIDAEPAEGEGGIPSYLCPWGQTAPFVIRASPEVEGAGARVLAPLVRFGEGPAAVERALWGTFRRFGGSRARHRRAVRAAYAAREGFRRAMARAGSEALATLERTGEAGVVIVGRPYNLYDPGLNLHIPQKLRRFYGANVLPFDVLPVERVGIRDLNPNLYWHYGRRILQAARLTSGRHRLHLVYLTNFKCGPDSYVKQFCEEAAGKPFLVLQFDGHGNDAGFLTRCEAYLDSKGVLRWWARRQTA